MAEDKKKKYGKGYVSGLRKPGESFMDFTNRRHEELYPGHRAAAKAAGASGLQAFGGKHRAFIDANRAKMPWLQQGQRYKSADWQRMLANQRGGMYGGTAGQVGGAPPGTRPAPTVGPNYNVLGGGQRPAIAPLQRKTAYMADPRNQAAAAAAQIRQTGGDASVAEGMFSSPRGIGQRYDFPPVGSAGRRQIGPTWAGTNQIGGAPRPPTQVQVPMGTGRQPGEHRGFGRGYGSPWRHGSFPVHGPQMTGMEWNRGGGGLGPRTPETTRPSWQQQDAFRRGWQMQGQQRNNRGFYNPLGGAPRPAVRSAPGRSQAQRRYMERPGLPGITQRMWANRGFPWSQHYQSLMNPNNY